jgi:Chaperone of endosialidase/Head domain of trimeric autotransporter adhesin
MKKKLLLLHLLTATFLANAQNVGIGTTLPLARLHVTDSSVLFSATGFSPITPGLPPIQGQGRRMMWYADKGAFRAGYVSSINWNMDNIGNYSVALGSNSKASGFVSFAVGNANIASGDGSTALGWQTTASGFSSIAMGYNTIASGNYSTAIGYQTNASAVNSTAIGNFATASGILSTAMGHSTASGSTSTAIGDFTTASGDGSTALGLSTTASGFVSTAIGNASQATSDYCVAIGDSVTANSWGSTSLGRHNDPIVTSPTTSWVLTEPLLIVGNGTGPSDKKNALVISKSGNIYIDASNKNDGTLTGNTLLFGTFNGTGEGISSKRTATGNQYGLDFYTGSANRMSITNVGNVGIGTNNPDAPLTLGNAFGKRINVFTGSSGNVGMSVQPGYFQIYGDYPGVTVGLGYQQNSLISGGNPTGFQYNLEIYGNGNATLRGTLTQLSDIRLKKDITPLQNSLQKITQLNGYNYYWKNENSDSSKQTGVLAQEVQKLFPELVKENKEGILSVNYSGLIPVLIESIKGEQKLIEKEQQQIDALSTHDKEQQNQIDELKKLVEKLAGKL